MQITFITIWLFLFCAEFLDAAAIDACNKYSLTEYAVKPTLFFEFHGSKKNVEELAEAAGNYNNW